MLFLFRLKRRLRWELYKLWDCVYSKFCFVPNVMKYDECIDYIKKNHASLARIGDGELICMFGKDLNFQKSTPEIRKRLREICHVNGKKIILGIPDTFEHLERYTPVEQDFWKSHFYFNRGKWYTFLRREKKYANAFLSRFYGMEYNQKLTEWRLSQLVTLWENRDVIFIEGKDSKLGVGNDLFSNAHSIRRIIAPSKDAFNKYEVIFETARAKATPDSLFIIALGPTATILAYDLSEAGYQALDLGHMDIEYEWFKMGVKEKVPVRGKFTNEAVLTGNANTEVEGQLVSQTYEKEIIARIL